MRVERVPFDGSRREINIRRYSRFRAYHPGAWRRWQYVMSRFEFPESYASWIRPALQKANITPAEQLGPIITPDPPPPPDDPDPPPSEVDGSTDLAPNQAEVGVLEDRCDIGEELRAELAVHQPVVE